MEYDSVMYGGIVLLKQAVLYWAILGHIKKVWCKWLVHSWQKCAEDRPSEPLWLYLKTCNIIGVWTIQSAMTKVQIGSLLLRAHVPTFNSQFQFVPKVCTILSLMWLLKFVLHPPEVLLWPFVHLSAWLVFQDHGVLSGPELILYTAVTTVGFRLCGCALYFSYWLPFLPHDT